MLKSKKYRYIGDLLVSDKKHDIFRGAVLSDLDEVMNALLEDPSSLNEGHPSGGLPPLSVAAHAGNWSIVDYLVKQPGIDVFKKCSAGILPVEYAQMCGHTTIIKVLSDMMQRHILDIIDFTDPDDSSPQSPPSNVKQLRPRQP